MEVRPIRRFSSDQLNGRDYTVSPRSVDSHHLRPRSASTCSRPEAQPSASLEGGVSAADALPATAINSLLIYYQLTFRRTGLPL